MSRRKSFYVRKKKRKNLNIGLRSPMGKRPNPKSIVKGITKAYS